MRQPAIWLSWSLEELHFSNMDTSHVFSTHHWYSDIPTKVKAVLEYKFPFNEGTVNDIPISHSRLSN